MDTDKALSKALGVEPEVKENTEVTTNVKEKTEFQTQEVRPDDRETDYSLSRNVFWNLINSGNRAIDNMTELAKESESPRAYEVLATLIKTVSESTKDLYDLHKKKKDLLEDKTRPTENINVEKAVFVGTTADLLSKIKSRDNT